MIILVLIAAFLIVTYILIYGSRRRKNRNSQNQISSVQKYNDTYIERRKTMQERRDITSGSTKYVTKYNSTEDYREK